MSQYPATQGRSSRRSGQILQHTAIVFAGMASIGLTVAAGSYVVDQIAESTRPHGAQPTAPHAGAPAGAPAAEPEGREYARGTAKTELVGLSADSRPLPVTLFAPQVPEAPRPAEAPRAPQTAQQVGHVDLPAASPRTAERNGLGGRLRLPGDTYVGANVAPGGPNSVSMTVDTNVFPAPSDRSGTPAPEVTRLHTNLDTDSGEVTLAVSGPLLGQRDMRLQRHGNPATVPDGPAGVPDGPATVPDDPAAVPGTPGVAAARPETVTGPARTTSAQALETAATGPRPAGAAPVLGNS